MDTIIFIALGFMLSRAFSAVSIVTFKCSKNSGLAYMFSNAAEKQVVKKSMFVYIVMIFTIMLFINSLLAIITILLTILCFVKYKKMSYNEFGGITGDLAGYFLQMLELILLIAVVIIWRNIMIEFVIGGTAQGKLKYVLDKNNLTKEDVCNGEECDYNNINKKILYNFHLLCKRLLKDKINILSFVDELLEKIMTLL